MHGIIFIQLQKFVETNYENHTWHALLKDADLSHRIYLPFKEYPDEDVMSIVTRISSATKVPTGTLLEDFGTFIVGDLVKLYGSFINRDWRTLDLIENTEEMVHKALRRRDPNAKPPVISCLRQHSNSLIVIYRSHRQMCAVAKGIIRGVGKYYQEIINVEESKCMHNGHDHCRIHVRVL